MSASTMREAAHGNRGKTMSQGGLRPLVAGNWKMNGLLADLPVLDELVRRMARPAGCDVLVCPPFTLLAAAAERLRGSPVALGAQDCHAAASGAHTGDIAPEMLAELGCGHVILGHSERRADHRESDALVRAKVEGAHRAGLVAIVCVGETEEERNAGATLRVVGRQLAGSLPDGATATNTLIAYEPVWAIGSGRTPEPSEIADLHGAIRVALAQRFAEGHAIRILYGGSVKPENAASLLRVEHVHGALVGGASLSAESFDGIIDGWRAGLG